jgi:hypothetical protein
MIADGRLKGFEDDDGYLRELGQLLVNIERFVPDQKRQNSTTRAPAKSLIGVRAENKGVDDRGQPPPGAAEDLRELKKLLVNIQRFIPEDDDAEDATATNVPHPVGASQARSLTDMRPRQAGVTIGPRVFLGTVFGIAGIVSGLVALVIVNLARPDLLRPAQNGEAPRAIADSALDVFIPKLIRAVPGVPFQLPFRLLPPGVRRGPLLLVIRGLPQGSLLSGAAQLGPDVWSIDGDKDLELELTLPNATEGTLQLEMLVRSASGAGLARATADLVVVAAGPESAGHSDAALAQRFLESARLLLATGELRSARLMLHKSAQLGNAQAALALGATFDPTRVGAAGLIDRTGDEQSAVFWYSEAKRLGSREAEERLRGLRHNRE